MELQEKITKTRKMIETLIRGTINPKWSYPQNAVAIKQLQNGIELLSGLYGVPDIDDERITDYVVYQIYRNRNFILEGRWMVSWLFSYNSLEKFKNQFMSENGKSGINYYIDQWLDEFELSREKLTALIRPSKESPLKGIVFLESEEPIKKRFFNTKMGLMLCQQSTTGWTPFSERCNKCDYQKECEQMTGDKYPELVRYRKEAYGKQKK